MRKTSNWLLLLLGVSTLLLLGGGVLLAQQIASAPLTVTVQQGQSVLLHWVAPVPTNDSNGNPIVVASYNIYRCQEPAPCTGVKIASEITVTDYYALFYAVTDGRTVRLTHFFLATGDGFFERFPQFQGKVLNKKLQIPLPADFFE